MFGNSDQEKQIAALRSENDDLSDRFANEQQLRGDAEARAAQMTLHRDPSQMDEIALKAASQIEDYFAQAWDGVAQRKSAIQCLIRGVIEKALTGGAP